MDDKVKTIATGAHIFTGFADVMQCPFGSILNQQIADNCPPTGDDTCCYAVEWKVVYGKKFGYE